MGDFERITAQERLHTQPGSVKTVADVLTAAADLIEPEGWWTQGATARTSTGERAVIAEPDAACWCMIGAVWEVAGWLGPIGEAEGALLDLLGVGNVARWNDAPERTQAEVVAALRAAAAKAATAENSVGTPEGVSP